MLIQLKKIHPTNMYLLGNENKDFIFHSHHFQWEVFVSFKVKETPGVSWVPLESAFYSLFAHPKPPHLPLPLKVQSACDILVTHDFLFFNQLLPLSSNLIHLTAHLWVDIPQQLKLNKFMSQLIPSLRPVPLLHSFGEWYPTSN